MIRICFGGQRSGETKSAMVTRKVGWHIHHFAGDFSFQQLLDDDTEQEVMSKVHAWLTADQTSDWLPSAPLLLVLMSSGRNVAREEVKPVRQYFWLWSTLSIVVVQRPLLTLKNVDSQRWQSSTNFTLSDWKSVIHVENSSFMQDYLLEYSDLDSLQNKRNIDIWIVCAKLNYIPISICSSGKLKTTFNKTFITFMMIFTHCMM